ncbi:hypothetical protein H0H87_008096 [Tephrocybe sp. NHM501043]|nr:hypothetical protein H0H87_008096 [Tephrocybe sp. NHM501043]
MAFYCSQEHWDAVKLEHVEVACDDGHDGLTQCQMNQGIRQDIVFASIMSNASPREFSWEPERVKPSWKSLEGQDWYTEYAGEIKESFGVTDDVTSPFVRGASVGLSMPMSILWALEHTNTDDRWTRKETLIIHVLGAYDVEITHASIFEEILHRLCIVYLKSLRACATGKRKRIHHLFVQTYHDYAKGSDFTQPDLAVSFNSGSSQESWESWQETISFLVKNEIPSVFTAYNREEAEAEAKLLRDAGANLIHELGPLKNVWGSISCKKEPNRVTGFYFINGWLAGGFR